MENFKNQQVLLLLLLTVGTYNLEEFKNW